ncbi:MAG: hypothetical protein M3R27_10880 [Bacteroidota bacterium]|nr:hypothetical protein [Bacteroidota bacterium]
MKKIIGFCLIEFSGITKAQTVSSELDHLNIIKVEDQILLSGYSVKDGKTNFEARLFDKKLNSLGSYEKQIPLDEGKGFSYQVMYGKTLLVWTGGKPNGYFLKLSKDLKKLSFYPKTPENKQASVVDDQHLLLPQFQLGLEGDPYGLGKGAGVLFTARPNAIENKRFINNDILDFDMKGDKLTRYKMNDTKLDPTFSPVWSSKITDNPNVKLTGITYAGEDAIFGCFIQKEDEWLDFVCRIDPKTGEVKFFREALFPEADEVFYISNTYYDKEADRLIVVGQLLLRKVGKDFFNALGILVFDSQGRIISTKKILFPEFGIEEPSGFNFKNKKLIAHFIGKLPNGNYFIGCENKAEGAPYTIEYFHSVSPVVASAQTTTPIVAGMIPFKKNVFYSTVGYSGFELTPKLEVVKTTLKLVESFSQKNTVITFEGFSKDGQRVVYSQLDKVRKSFSVIDYNSDDRFGGRKEIEGDAYDFRNNDKGQKRRDIYFCKVVDDQVLFIRKRSELETFTFTTIPIK